MERDPRHTAVWRKRVTRRDVLKGAGTALGAAWLGSSLVGCGSSTSPQATPGTGSGGTPVPSGPKRGGIGQFSVPGQMTHLNAQEGGDQNSTGILMRHVYDHLFNYDYINGRYDLSLAQSVEEAPDHMTYTFKLKPNAKWQNLPPVNGRNVTSEDVKVSWDSYAANPRLTGKQIFTDYIDHLETPDPQTFIIKMKQPFAWFFSTQGFGAPHPTIVMPKEIIDQNLMEKVAVGSGGYQVQEFDPAKNLVLRKRPDGWHNGPDRPYIDKLVFTVISDTAARSAALKAKQIDQLAARDKLEAEEFKSYGPDMVIRKERSYTPVILLRSDDQGFFKDVRVREAIYNCIDVKDLIDRVDLGEGEYTGPVPPFLEHWSLPQDELKKVFPHDLKKAKDLMAAANWDSTKEIEFKYPSDQKTQLLVEVLQQQFAAIGIKTKLVPQDTTTVWTPDTFQKKNFQLTAVYRLYTGQSPDPYLQHYTTKGRGAGNDARWSDPEVDAIVAKQLVEFDEAKQRQIIIDAQRLILSKFPPIVKPYAPFVYTANWDYYHDARFEQAYVGTFGGYSWIDSDSPNYPKR